MDTVLIRCALGAIENAERVGAYLCHTQAHPIALELAPPHRACIMNYESFASVRVYSESLPKVSTRCQSVGCGEPSASLRNSFFCRNVLYCAAPMYDFDLETAVLN